MKKSMLFAAALAGVMSMSMIAGAESADDVLSKMFEAGKAAKEVTTTAQLNGDVSLNFPDMEVNMNVVADGDMTVAADLNDMESAVTGAFSVNLMGQSFDFTAEAYTSKESEDTLAAYANAVFKQGEETNESGWTKTEVPMGEMQQMIDQINGMNITLEGLGFEITDDAAALDNGTTCYELKASLTAADLVGFAKPVLEEAGASVDDETLEMINSMTEGLKFNFAYYVDKETYLPQLCHFDMNDSDLSIIQSLLGSMEVFGTDSEGNPVAVELSLTNLSLDMFYDYTTPVEVVIPEEAIASAQEINASEVAEESSSLLEMVQNG